MLRTASLSLALAMLGGFSASWLTEGFQVWTAEGARRLAVIDAPVAAPPVLLAGPGPGLAGAMLPGLLAGDDSATIVDFIYTRCARICAAMGSGFQQLQQAIAMAPDAGVKLLSISFDPSHDDVPSLQRYASQWRADPQLGRVATVRDPAELQRLLDAFQVVVISDAQGGYEHNTALLVVDARGRLVRIFDDTELDAALSYARSISRRPEETPGRPEFLQPPRAAPGVRAAGAAQRGAAK